MSMINDHSDDHHLIDDHNKNSVLIAKISAICVLFISSMIFGLIPFKLADLFKWNEQNTNPRVATIISSLLSFGGGVLLSTTFLHLLPEVQQQIQDLQESKILPKFKFSFSSLLMCTGFFIMYFVEQLVHTYLNKHEKNKNESNCAESAFKRGISIRESSIMKNKQKNKNKNLELNELERVQEIQQQQHSHSHLPKIIKDDDIFVTSIRGLLVVLALSIHELFEGLAVGLEKSSKNVWYMFAAVSAHKLVLAFCVGVELVITKTKIWLSLIYVLTFAIVSPIGIGIGILLTNCDNTTTELTAVILQGLAAGTLLYVVFFEILLKQERASGLLQYFMVLVGFTIMFGLQFLSKLIFCFIIKTLFFKKIRRLRVVWRIFV